MTMPSRVSAERSLWAQIAAIASLRVSMNFTAQILRLPAHFGCIAQVAVSFGVRRQSEAATALYVFLNFWRLQVESVSRCASHRNPKLFPPQRFNGIESRGFPCRPQAEDDPNARGNANADRDGPDWHIGRQRRIPVDQESEQFAYGKSSQSADSSQHNGLNQKLREN